MGRLCNHRQTKSPLYLQRGSIFSVKRTCVRRSTKHIPPPIDSQERANILLTYAKARAEITAHVFCAESFQSFGEAERKMLQEKEGRRVRDALQELQKLCKEARVSCVALLLSQLVCRVSSLEDRNQASSISSFYES